MSIGQAGQFNRNFLGEPRAGGDVCYIQASSFGATIIQPTQGGNGALQTIGGGGNAFLQQVGVFSVNGSAGERVPIQALRLALTQLASFFIGAATVVPAPDFSPGTGDGTTTLQKFAVIVTGTDWTGDFAAAPDGTIFALLNNSGGGQALNIVDVNVGGSIFSSFPYVALGFKQIAFFLKAGGTTILLTTSPVSYFQGSLDRGSRVVTVTSDADTMIYQAIATTGAGSKIHSFTCDVTATDASTGALIGKWLNVQGGFDDSFNIDIGASGVGTANGTPFVEHSNVPGGAASLKLNYNTSFYRLMFSRPPGVDTRVVVNNWRQITGQL